MSDYKISTWFSLLEILYNLDNVTLPGGTGYQNSDFEDKNFQVITVPTTGTFTITQSSNASGTVSTGGSF